MSSILTNTSAMVALQTLKGINSSLAKTQDEISTGKSIGSAKDNAAVWAISKVMESDVAGFTAISDGLSLAESTVATARKATENISEALKQIKAKIVAAQTGTGVAQIQDDIDGIVANITSTVSTAQVNGVSLINTTGTVDYLGSLDRDAAGNVTASTITVARQDLSIGAYVALGVFAGSDGVSGTADTFGTAVDAGGTGTIVIDAVALAEGDKISITMAGRTASYTVTAQDAAATTPADLVAVGLKGAIEDLGIADLTVDYDSGTAGTLVVTNGAATDLAISGRYQNAGAGGLGDLSTIDVTTVVGAQNALTAIEGLINTVIDAGAAFGSVESRIKNQANFVSKLSDALVESIGAMVDADMEEASARLQALQVQQQLGIQSLSIANQAPQNVLSLFK